MKLFYVYALFDHAGTVRYIGKGRGSRWTQHIKDKKTPKPFIDETLRRLGDLPRVKIREHLTEHAAWEIELALIRAIGRFPDGPLVNRTDKGSGPNSEQVRKWHAGRTAEQKRATAKKARATYATNESPEVIRATARRNALAVGSTALSERMRAIKAAEPAERRVEIASMAGKASAKVRTPEQRRAQGLAHKAYIDNLSPEERHKTTAGARASLTSELLSAFGTRGAAKANAARTPEQRRELARKAALAGAAKRRKELDQRALQDRPLEGDG